MSSIESLTADRTSGRALCRQSIGSFEDSRVSHAENKRSICKTGHASTSTSSTVQYDVYGRTCGFRIGLFSHRKTHQWSEIRRVDDSVHHLCVSLFVHRMTQKNCQRILTQFFRGVGSMTATTAEILTMVHMTMQIQEF